MRRSLLNIFMYHRILPEASGDGVTVKMFTRQLDYIRKKYSILGVSQLIGFLDGEFMPVGPSAVITFDDGWLDNWLFATPVLKDKGITAILAVITGFIHDGPVRSDMTGGIVRISADEALREATYKGNLEAFLSWDEINAMKESKVWSIQAHGHTHTAGYCFLQDSRGFSPDKDNWPLGQRVDRIPSFVRASHEELVSNLACRRKAIAPKFLKELRESTSNYEGLKRKCDSPFIYTETKAEFQDRLRKDFTRCISLIVKHTGVSPVLLFWPWGHYSNVALQIAKECGFRYTFSTEKGYVKPHTNKYVLPRIGVRENWRKFKRNSIIYRDPVLAWFHDRISPSPSGLKTDDLKRGDESWI